MPTAQAGLPAGHAARLAARDPAPGRARGPRPGRRRRRARARRSTPSAAARRSRRSARSTPARRRSTRRRADLAKVNGPGIDLVADDPEPGAGAADRRLRAARRRRRRPTSAPRSSRRCGPRSSPASTGCTASSRSPRPTLLHVQAGRGRRADRPAARWSGARTASRTSSTARPRRSTAINLKTKKATVVVKAGTEEQGRHDRRRRRATSRSAARTC